MDVLLITPVVSPVGQSLLQCAYIFPFLKCVPAMDGAHPSNEIEQHTYFTVYLIPQQYQTSGTRLVVISIISKIQPLGAIKNATLRSPKPAETSAISRILTAPAASALATS